MRPASNRRMGRNFFWFVGRFILFLLAIGFAFLLAISVVLTGEAAAQQASPSAAPTCSSAAPPPPTKRPHGKYFEVTLCTYPPEIPKGLVRWARTEKGTLFTTTVGAFWDALPEGTTVYFYDPEGPECKRRIPSPKPTATAVEPSEPLAPPSNGPPKGGQPNQAGGDARKKAEKAAAAEADRKKEAAKEDEERKRKQAEDDEERKRKEAEERAEEEERKREQAEDDEERKREEAEERAEAEAEDQKARRQRELDEAVRERNSPEARWERGDAVLPPVSYADVPRTCEPPRKGKVQEARPGFKCVQVDLFWIEQPIEPLREPLAPQEPPPPPQEVSALPRECAPLPGGITRIRSIDDDCSKPYERFPTPPPLPPLEEEQLPRVPHARNGPMPMFAASGEWKPPAAPSDGCTATPEDGELTDASCPPPKPPKTLSEYMRSEAALAAAMLSLNLNVELPKDGSRNGIVGGLNRDGIDVPAAQVAMIALTLGLEVVSFTGKFDKVLKKAIKAGKQLFVKQSSPLARAFAKELAETYGIHLADAMRANKTIVPYELGQKITANLGNRLHAHHLIEVKCFKDVPELMTRNPNLAPSVLLTDEAHRKLHKELAALGEPKSIEQLLAKYREAYKKDPNWIKAVEWFLGK